MLALEAIGGRIRREGARTVSGLAAGLNAIFPVLALAISAARTLRVDWLPTMTLASAPAARRVKI